MIFLLFFVVVEEIEINTILTYCYSVPRNTSQRSIRQTELAKTEIIIIIFIIFIVIFIVIFIIIFIEARPRKSLEHMVSRLFPPGATVNIK